MIKFLDLSGQYEGIKDEIDGAISSVLSECAFIGGKHVKTFEEAFAAYQNAAYCVAVGNGTDALEIALEALQLNPGSEVIVPANSFIASSEAVSRTGHKVVFCDIDPGNYTINAEDACQRITGKTSAIMAVHLQGHPCDMDPLLKLARNHDLKIIEDCAQAHGAEYKGARVGCIGDIGTFSFFPGKNLGAYGDGGAIVTANPGLAERSRKIANHGRLTKYNHEIEGRNSRLDGIQAAILTVKLRHLESWTEKRRFVAATYKKLLKDSDIITPVEMDNVRHVYHLFVVRVGNRNFVQKELKEHGIATGIHYPVALPHLQAYKHLGYSSDDFPVATRYSGEILSLPVYPELRTDQIECICKHLRNTTSSSL